MEVTSPNKTEGYKCGTCGKIFAKKGDLNAHASKHPDGTKNHVCKVCGKAFFDPSARNAHEKFTHGPGFKCNECGKTFKYPRALKLHMVQHDPDKQEYTEEVKEKARSLVKDLGITETAKQLKIPYSRVRDWTTTGRFMCTLCGKCYRSQPKLADHMRVEHERLDGKKKGALFSKEFREEVKAYALKHSRRAAQERFNLGETTVRNFVRTPILCEYCSYNKAQTKSQLQIHLKSVHDITEEVNIEPYCNKRAPAKIVTSPDESFKENNKKNDNNNPYDLKLEQDFEDDDVDDPAHEVDLDEEKFASEQDSHLSSSSEKQEQSDDKPHVPDMKMDSSELIKEEVMETDEEDVDLETKDKNFDFLLETDNFEANFDEENVKESVESVEKEIGDNYIEDSIKGENEDLLKNELIKMEVINDEKPLIQDFEPTVNSAYENNLDNEKRVSKIAKKKEKPKGNKELKMKKFERWDEEKINFNINFQAFGINEASDQFIISSDHIEDENFMQVIYSKKYKSKSKLYECKVCNKQCKCLADIKIHLEAHSDSANYNCEFCFMKFKHKSNLGRHIKTKHSSSENRPVFKCQYCFKELTAKHSLLEHEKLHENEMNGNIKPFKCETCDKCFTTKNGLAEHEKNIHSSKLASDSEKHLCPLCGKEFKNKKCLRNHIQWHNGFRYKRDGHFSCDQCPKVYKDKKALLSHQRIIHLGETANFMCNICSKQFSRETSLWAHQKLHTGNTIQSCSEKTQQFKGSPQFKKSLKFYKNAELQQYCFILWLVVYNTLFDIVYYKLIVNNFTYSLQ